MPVVAGGQHRGGPHGRPGRGADPRRRPRPGWCWPRSGVALVLLGLVVADRLARTLSRRSPTCPRSRTGWPAPSSTPARNPAGPPEVREVAGALNHLAGADPGSAARGARAGRRPVPPAAHAAHRAAAGGRVAARPGRGGPGRRPAADGIERAVTAVIQQARRRGVERRRRAATRPRWSPTGWRSGRCWPRTPTGRCTSDLPAAPLPVAVPADDLAAALDALLGNVFAHTPDGTALAVSLRPRRPAARP